MPPEQAALAVKKYRERFEQVGWLENLLYDGMDSLLRGLQSAGCRLAVASSKPTVFVERILNHFGIADCFAVVVGSELSGARTKKEEVVQEALRQLFGESRPAPHTAAMIGDRRFDVEGAKAHQLAGGHRRPLPDQIRKSLLHLAQPISVHFSFLPRALSLFRLGLISLDLSRFKSNVIRPKSQASFLGKNAVT